MKKALSLILALVMCLSLCACGGEGVSSIEDTAVNEVIQMIDALEIALTSGKSITAAENAYAALTEDQKSAVTNYRILVDARASYDRILNVFTLIEAIGSVSKSSEAAIVAAEKAFGELSIEERIAITNANTLTAARSAYDAIPTEVILTVENVKDYFSLEHSSTTSKKDIYGYYGRAIAGSVVAKQTADLVGMDNVTISVCVTCSVGRPVDGSLNAANTYETCEYNMTITVAASSGTGSASYKTDGHLTSEYWYPTIEVTSVEVTAVTGTVTVD